MRCNQLILLSMLLAVACNAPQAVSSEADATERAIRNSRAPNSVAVDAAETGIDLTSYLRKVAGVNVRGSGPDAVIRIRGNVSLLGDTSPLFVINGTVMGTNFNQVYDAVDINEIARVTVLKNVTETNAYGMQGANGVIEIKLKK